MVFHLVHTNPRGELVTRESYGSWDMGGLSCYPQVTGCVLKSRAGHGPSQRSFLLSPGFVVPVCSEDQGQIMVALASRNLIK